VRYLIIFLILFVFDSTSFAQNIKVNLFNGFNIKTVVVKLTEGKYELSAENIKTIKLKKNNTLYFTVVGDSISAWDLDNHIGMFKEVDLINKSKRNEFRIEPAYPALKERRYQGNLNLSNKDSTVFIINNIDLEKYVAGVVESESGPKAPKEYYKSQAIICRTYALDHLDRHTAEGFNLCDDVHCQVYKSKSYQNDTIIEATLATLGLVITDEDFNLITAAFHSNSGGQTINSEDVWSKETSYLKAVVDTFAYNLHNSVWKDSTTITKWINYLDTSGLRIDRNNFSTNDLKFEQTIRTKYLTFNGDSIPLKKIRKDFGFKSTYFSTSVNNNYVIFHGKGYGHGVGMSQQSAMKMARLGYSYYEIITFFYQNIRIVNVDYVDINLPSN
jgi:stage II sporulation protein D (peptidoglycan lytic transglycosylase)